MKSRIISISAILSIVVVILLLIPFKRDIIIKIDRPLLLGLNQISMEYIRDGVTQLSRWYYFRDNQSKFLSEIKDSVRLSKGEYVLKVFLIYQKDKYIKKEMKFNIGYLDFGEIVINLL